MDRKELANLVKEENECPFLNEVAMVKLGKDCSPGFKAQIYRNEKGEVLKVVCPYSDPAAKQNKCTLPASEEDNLGYCWYDF